MEENHNKKVIVIGAGPGGLTAAYELYKAGIKSIVLEKDKIVGGLARTVNHEGYRFDIGGHRFFTKVDAVENMWREVLNTDLLRRRRLSRIYYNRKFFLYPLNISNTLWGLGLWNSFLILLSYLKSQIFPERSEETFEQWVSNRFGKRLYRIFFKTYTEKVWGIPCSEIMAEWVAQRIKGLSLLTAIKNSLIGQRAKNKGAVIKTLIDEFDYPRQGPGMMWEMVSHIIQGNGSEVRLETEVDKILIEDNEVIALEAKNNGKKELIAGTHFISSMPIRELIQKIEPAVPEEVLRAAMRLNYRDFLTVALIIGKSEVFPDNWIYIHDPEVKVGRIQNFKNWSPYMVPDHHKTCLGLEYFCFEGDELWTMSDQELIEFGKKELEILGLTLASEVEDGMVVRMPKAYPVYDSEYHESLEIVRQFLSRMSNLQLIGRNGMHKYNNQDHSMLTAMLAAKNLLGASYDLWKVNADPEYHEEIKRDEMEEGESFKQFVSAQPQVPTQAQKQEVALNQKLTHTFARMDKLGFAIAIATVCALAVFAATVWVMIIAGGEVAGTKLQLLSQYFIGYSVSLKGAFIGMLYGLLSGFIWGWLYAYVRNLSLGFFMYNVRKKSEKLSIGDLLDHI